MIHLNMKEQPLEMRAIDTIGKAFDKLNIYRYAPTRAKNQENQSEDLTNESHLFSIIS